MRPLRFFCLFALFLVTGSASAAILTWPGAAPCNATLQACLDAAVDGDTVRITTTTPITESITLVDRSLSIQGYVGPSARVRFQGAGIDAKYQLSSGTLRLGRLSFDGGGVQVAVESLFHANVDLRELDIRNPPDGGTGILLLANGGSMDANLYHNRVEGTPVDGKHLMTVVGYGSTGTLGTRGELNLNASYNRIVSRSATTTNNAGMWIEYSKADGSLLLQGNEVRGSFKDGGIGLFETSNAGGNGSFVAHVYNNVVVGGDLAVDWGIVVRAANGEAEVRLGNNTITRLAGGFYLHSFGAARIKGRLVNNLVRGRIRALYASPTALDSGFFNGYNLFDGAVEGLTPGVGTLTGPAGLVSDLDPRLLSSSPAVDAGYTGELLPMAVAGAPMLDADGLRRLKKKDLATGGAAQVDMGAYEYGDLSFRHVATSDTLVSGMTRMDYPWLSGHDNALLQATVYWGTSAAGGGIEVPDPFGAYWVSPYWHLGTLSGVNSIPAGARFNLFLPAPSNQTFRHSATAANISGHMTRIEHIALPETDNDRFVMVTQNVGYNAFPVSVYRWYSGSEWRWYVTNPSTSQPMLPGSSFNVYVQELSPNAFRVTSSAQTRHDAWSVIVDHPLLNNTSCAQPVVARWDSVSYSGTFDLNYQSNIKRWLIYGSEQIPNGIDFSVLVDPRQVYECTGGNDVIFRDGFD